MNLLILDYIRPFSPLSLDRSYYILVTIDYFSYYIMACIVSSATAHGSWVFLTIEVVPLFSWLLVVYIDNRLYFTSSDFHQPLT